MSKRNDNNVDTSTDLLTVKEAAKFLRLAPGTIYHWAETGRLDFIKLGSSRIRFSRAALEKFLADSVVPAAGAKS